MDLPTPRNDNIYSYVEALSRLTTPKGANQHFSGRSKLWARPKGEAGVCRVWDHKKNEGNDIGMGLSIAKAMMDRGETCIAEKVIKGIEECNREDCQERGLTEVAMVVAQYSAQWRKG